MPLSLFLCRPLYAGSGSRGVSSTRACRPMLCARDVAPPVAWRRARQSGARDAATDREDGTMVLLRAAACCCLWRRDGRRGGCRARTRSSHATLYGVVRGARHARVAGGAAESQVATRKATRAAGKEGHEGHEKHEGLTAVW